jgi:hypothetical protein
MKIRGKKIIYYSVLLHVFIVTFKLRLLIYECT